MKRSAGNSDRSKLERQHAALIAEERRKRGQWYWLSFANSIGFLGGAIVWAQGIETAVLRARELNISGGFRGDVDVFCEPIPTDVVRRHIPTDLRNRLLAENEILQRLKGYRSGPDMGTGTMAAEASAEPNPALEMAGTRRKRGRAPKVVTICVDDQVARTGSTTTPIQ
jgi:hypothetical protein